MALLVVACLGLQMTFELGTRKLEFHGLYRTQMLLVYLTWSVYDWGICADAYSNANIWLLAGTGNSPLLFLSNETPVLKRESFTSKPKLSRFSCRLFLVAKSLLFSRKKGIRGLPLLPQNESQKSPAAFPIMKLSFSSSENRCQKKSIHRAEKWLKISFFLLLFLLRFSHSIFFHGGIFVITIIPFLCVVIFWLGFDE